MGRDETWVRGRQGSREGLGGLRKGAESREWSVAQVTSSGCADGRKGHFPVSCHNRGPWCPCHSSCKCYSCRHHPQQSCGTPEPSQEVGCLSCQGPSLATCLLHTTDVPCVFADGLSSFSNPLNSSAKLRLCQKVETEARALLDISFSLCRMG